MKKLLLASLMLGSVASYAQTRKVMLEDFTGDWCQFCPNGTKGIEDILATNPTNFLPVAVHCSNGDALEIIDGVTLKNTLNVTGVPSGAIDRKIHSGQTKIPVGINGTASQWKSIVPTRLAETAIASVSITNKQKLANGSYSCDVNVKFTAMPTKAGVPINVNLLILENGIAATGSLAQTNSTAHYGGGNPLTTADGYWHNNVLRQMVGGTWGFANVVPSPVVVGTVYKKTVTFTIPATGIPAAWDKSKIDIYAYVAYDGTVANDEKEILNAEKATLTGFYPTGVNAITNDVQIMNAFPNPARSTDIINVEYNISKGEKVTMRVYNVTGQVVAMPYDSEEVEGGHTILWRAADHSLPAGTYFMEVSSASGKHTQKIVIN